MRVYFIEGGIILKTQSESSTRPKTDTQRYNDRVTHIRSFIKSYFTEKGYSPTAEEISNHLGLKSRSTIWNWLDLMKENGQLDFDKRIGRSFRLPGQKVTFQDSK